MASMGNTYKSVTSSNEGKEQHHEQETCGLCKDTAVAYCKTCQKHLCYDCKTGHTTQTESTNHDICTLANVRHKCWHHNSNDIDIFCELCETVCCATCENEKHKAHNCQNVSGFIPQIKDLCLGKSKNLHDTFDRMVGKQEDIQTTRDTRHKQYEELKRNLQDRKHQLIELITAIADDEIQKVTSIQSTVDEQFVVAGDELKASVRRCEQTLGWVTTVVMGTDDNQVARCLQSIEIETDKAKMIQEEVERLEMRILPNMPTLRNSLKHIVQKLFKVSETSDKLAKTTMDKGVQTAEYSAIATRRDIQQALLVHKTPLLGYTCLSKPVCNKRILSQYGGDISLMKYKDTCKDVNLNLSSLVKPKSSRGECLLIIDNLHYIIISNGGIHLCDDTSVIKLAKHTADGYIPDAISFVTREMFVSICYQMKKIRYHSTNTLQCINTYDLHVNADMAEMKYQKIPPLITDNHDIVLQADYKSSKTVLLFSKDGILKEITSMPKIFSECLWYTVCMTGENQILAARNDGSIHRFTLSGVHKLVGKVEGDVKYVWGSAVDDEFIYVTYSLAIDTARHWICKLRLE